MLVLVSFVIVAALGCATAADTGKAAARRELGRGHKWVRSRPFTTMALVLNTKTLDIDQYTNVCNTLLAWKPRDELFAKAAAASVPWHGHAIPQYFYGKAERNRFDDVMKTRIREIYDT